MRIIVNSLGDATAHQKEENYQKTGNTSTGTERAVLPGSPAEKQCVDDNLTKGGDYRVVRGNDLPSDVTVYY